MIEPTKELMDWAFAHPYLFTMIKLGTPSVYAVILFAGSKIVTSVLGARRI